MQGHQDVGKAVNDRWIMSSFRSGVVFMEFVTGFLSTRGTSDVKLTAQHRQLIQQSPSFSEPYNSNADFLIGNRKTRSHDVLTLVPRCSLTHTT